MLVARLIMQTSERLAREARNGPLAMREFGDRGDAGSFELGLLIAPNAGHEAQAVGCVPFSPAMLPPATKIAGRDRNGTC